MSEHDRDRLDAARPEGRPGDPPAERRRRHVLRWIGGGIAALLLLLAIALWFGLSSERVAQDLIARALASTGGTVKIGRIAGQLRGPLILHDVSVDNPAFDATVDSVLLDWSPTGLLRRQVRIDRLHVTGVHIVLPDSVPPDTAPPKRPELPMDVLLGDVRADRISVDAPGDVRIRNGSARMTGRAEDYRLVARARLSAPALRDTVPLEAAGHGDLVHLAIDSSHADILEGRINGVGTVAWFPQVSWDLGVNAGGLRPGLMLADPAAWPGAVAFRARTQGVVDSVVGPRGVFAVDSLGGAIRGQPLAGTVTVRFAGNSLEIPAMDARWGSARATGSGTVAEAIDLEYRIDVGRLGTAMPGARGRLTVAGTAEGPRLTPRIRARIDGRNIAYGANRVSRVTGTADVDLAEGGRNTVDLRGSGAAVGAQAIDRIAMSLRGTQRRHRVTAEVLAPGAEVDLALAGGLAGKRWNGSVTAVDLDHAVAGTWTLERPARLDAGAASATLAPLCLGSDSARVCAGGAWLGGTSWRATSSIERLALARLPIAALDSLIGDRDRLTGTIEATMDGASAGGRLSGALRAETRGVALLYRAGADTALQRVSLDSGVVAVTAGPQGIRGSLGLRVLDADSAEIGNAAGTLALPDYRRLGAPLERQRIEARLQGRIDSLDFVTLLTKQVDSIGGAVTFDVAAGGTVGAPRVEGGLRLTELAAWLPGHRFSGGSVEATVDATVHPDKRLDGRLRVVPRDVRYEYELNIVPRRLLLDSAGLDVRAGADGVHGTLDVALLDTTGARLATLAGRLDLPEYRRIGEAMAQQPLALRVEGAIPDLAFAQSLTAQVDTLAGRLGLTLDVEGTVGAPVVAGTLRLDSAVARLPYGARVSGDVDGDLSARVAADSTLTADLRIVPRGMRVEYLENDQPRRITMDTTAIHLATGPAGMRGELDLRLSNEAGTELGVVTGRLAVPGYRKLGAPTAPLPVQASLDGRIDDIAFARAFTPQVDSLAGRVTLDAEIGGTLGDPDLVGGLRLEDGAIRMPLLGALYRDIQLAARGDRAGALAVSGRMRSGDGELTIEGRTPVRPTVENPGRLTIRGTDFEAMNTGEVHAVVSPTLEVGVAGDSINVSGDVRLPLLAIELSEIPEFAVAPSDDVIFIDDSLAARRAVWKLAADVRVELGDSASFKGFNFTAELGGALRAMQNPDEPARGSGAIVIEQGNYKAYGQDLTITQGRVRFAGGPVNNPSLDIRATRTADDGTVAGLLIAGTLKTPRVTIFSEPAMSQNMALSYIVLGRAPGAGGGSDGSLVSKAATSLGLRGGNLIAGTLGKGIGLDDATIETEGDLQKASFVAGRYLSPSLYVSYGIGLFDPISTLRLRYIVSDKFTLQAERGAATGADVLFRIERGGEEGAAAAGAAPR